MGARQDRAIDALGAIGTTRRFVPPLEFFPSSGHLANKSGYAEDEACWEAAFNKKNCHALSQDTPHRTEKLLPAMRPFLGPHAGVIDQRAESMTDLRAAVKPKQIW
ncbi:MAG: hypothetical protein NZ899_12630 [Thermoguttaceae bacterium]|nr:hypothetical protein [Thermoguttaceae bacterium]MDW8079946.1 hypothetical protein [Thermoguttaceae bacterium]